MTKSKKKTVWRSAKKFVKSQGKALNRSPIGQAAMGKRPKGTRR